MKNFDYSSFTVLDFVLDDYFKQWVQHPDAESEVFWREWMALYPHQQSTIEEARQTVLNLKFREDQLPVESFQRIREHLDAVFDEQEHKTQPLVETQPSEQKVLKLQRPAWGNWYRAAAMISGILVCGVILWMTVYRNRTTRIATGFGKTQLITLPDGSQVSLNANSTLTYQPGWEQEPVREVWLEGEAFFKVVKKNRNGRIPFVVHTGQLNVRVLGTEFNVSNRREQTTVVLNSGSVKLEAGSPDTRKDVLMKPGDLVQFSEKDQSFTRKAVNPEKFSSWTQNQLIFDNTPLKEIAQILEDTYGMKVHFADPDLANRTFTATIPVNKPEVLLTALSESLNLRVSRNGNEVTLGRNP